MSSEKDLLSFYNEDEDFKRYVNSCINTYGKDLDYTLKMKIVESYYDYLKEEKGKNEN